MDDSVAIVSAVESGFDWAHRLVSIIADKDSAIHLMDARIGKLEKKIVRMGGILPRRPVGKRGPRKAKCVVCGYPADVALHMPGTNRNGEPVEFYDHQFQQEPSP